MLQLAYHLTLLPRCCATSRTGQQPSHAVQHVCLDAHVALPDSNKRTFAGIILLERKPALEHFVTISKRGCEFARLGVR